MICPRCRNQLSDDSVACNKCGLLFNFQNNVQPSPIQYQQNYQALVQPNNYQVNMMIKEKKTTSKKLIIGILTGVLFLILILIVLPLALSFIPKSIDYGDAESFERALNNGENCVGMVVKVEISEVKPNSFFGYNLWSGRHLNFVSNTNPNVDEGEYLIAEITEVDSFMESWIIHYKIVRNGKITSNTKYKDN